MSPLPLHEELEVIPGRGRLVRLIEGPHTGSLYLILDPDAVPPSRSEVRRRASDLLESLLDPDQLESWRCRRTFVVKTPYGDVRLGRLHNLDYRGPSRLHMELCVVPEDYKRLPPEDIWTNLLLTLRGAPELFFRTANYRFPRQEKWNCAPPPIPGVTRL